MKHYSSAFHKAMTLLLQREGGYVNHPLDKGGPTNMGITLQTLGAHRAQKVNVQDVQTLEQYEAMEIYYNSFWKPLNLDFVNDERLAIIFFDQAVNRGTRTVAKQIQGSVGAKKDGVIGEKSIHLINSENPIAVGLSFIKYAQIQYVRIVEKNPSQLVFLEGWINRTHHLLDILLWREIQPMLF